MAQQGLGRLVVEPVLNDISDVDREFLVAMALDGGPSEIGDIAEQLGKTSG